MSDASTGRRHGYGWLPDKPDHRDFAFTPTIKATNLPRAVDLRAGCGPVRDQGRLSSCTGFAIGGAIEFDRAKQNLPAFTPSHLFIYYNERLVENTVESDSGASIRDGIKSVNHEGVCDETLWPYRVEQFTQRPPAAAYDDALLHQALQYQSVAKTAAAMKACLAEGYPFVAGISIYESFESAEVARTGKVPMPQANEARLGGHAILCVGYDTASRRYLFQNSWSSHWGASGSFTLPFSYMTHTGYACDMWTIRLVEGATA
ncbi:MAG: C1 family peptidase [Thermomicrobiales bacterium]